MIKPDVRRVLDAAAIAHLATVLADVAPHSVPPWFGAVGEQVAILTVPSSQRPATYAATPVAVSLTPADNPLRADRHPRPGCRLARGGRRLGGRRPDRDEMPRHPYSRELERVVALIEPERQCVGMS